VTALVVRGDARRLPLPDASVDLIVTSPPYFALRSYQDGGEHYAGQIGSEPTPAEFLKALLDCTREWVRVLKPCGSIFVNLGDKYAERTGPPRPGYIDDDATVSRPADRPARGRRGSVPVKSLMGIPWRYALGCIDELGLILRAELVWSKPNGLPESVTDRVRRSHETWFHLTMQPRYYSAVDEIRQPYAPKTLSVRSMAGSTGARGDRANSHQGGDRYATAGTADRRETMHPLGALPGSVWEVPTEPLTAPPELGVDHFAAFPTEWPRRLILGWSPPGICVECGEGRRPVADVSYERIKSAPLTAIAGGTATEGRHKQPWFGARSHATITGYACACPTPNAPTRPSVIVDPFGGTGTTALVASALGRTGISVDLSHDYSRLAAWRTSDPAQRAKAMRINKPPVQVTGQADLFTGHDGEASA